MTAEAQRAFDEFVSTFNRLTPADQRAVRESLWHSPVYLRDGERVIPPSR